MSLKLAFLLTYPATATANIKSSSNAKPAFDDRIVGLCVILDALMNTME